MTTCFKNRVDKSFGGILLNVNIVLTIKPKNVCEILKLNPGAYNMP